MSRRTTLLPCLILALAPAAVVRAGVTTVVLSNGDRVRGELVERTDEAIVIDHPALGRLRVPVAQVEPEESNPGLLGTHFLEGWDKELQLGASGTHGNSREINLRAALNLDYQDDERRWGFAALYRLGVSDGERSDDNARVELTRDWLLPDSPWFLFARSRYAFDEFESYRHRVSLSAGPGYRFLDTERFELEGRLAPTVTWEDGEKDQIRPEALLGLQASWTIAKGHSFVLTNEYFQTLDTFEFRNRSTADWKIALSAADGLSLHLGVQNEYDSDAENKRNDLNYYTSLGLDF